MNVPEMIEAVQAELGVKTDRIAGPETWQAIFEKIVPKSKWSGSLTSPLTLADIAESYLGKGIAEVAGPMSHPQIKEWIKQCEEKYSSVNGPIDDSKYPWCGVFAGACALQARMQPPAYFQSAIKWLNFGRPVAVADVRRGDVMVKKRTGGNHVAIVSRLGPTGVFVTGGNQSNAVTTVFYKYSDITGFRRP